MEKTKLLNREQANQKGITLISLVVTIIILLILAGITTSTLTGDNGIIKNTNYAKEQTEIAEEKEIVDRATIQAMGNNKRGNLTQDELQKQLNKITDSGKTEVSDSGEEFEIVFADSNRYYTVDKDGKIAEEGKIVIDKSPGDITKDENGNTLKGDESEPYEIWCIEDLCDFSNRINNKSIANSYVSLMQALDFKSNRSYVNGKILTGGLISSCNSIEELKNSLAEGEGFTPIGIYAPFGRFEGTFEGNNKKIKNLYINREGLAGLFGNIYNANINNLGITGNVKSINNTAGGIAGYCDKSNYNNCYNKAIIVSNICAGGIVGETGGNLINISNCYNLGDVTAPNNTGGIAGRCSGKIEGCYNLGNIKSTGGYAGGLIGGSVGPINITDSYNIGNVNADIWQSAGIIAQENANVIVENCYNLGEISQIGSSWVSYATAKGIGGNTIINCYNFGIIISERTKPNAVGGSSNNIKSCYYNSESSGTIQDLEGLTDVKNMDVKDFVNLLNNYKDETGNFPIDWKKWKVGDKGYPTFE